MEVCGIYCSKVYRYGCKLLNEYTSTYQDDQGGAIPKKLLLSGYEWVSEWSGSIKGHLHILHVIIIHDRYFFVWLTSFLENSFMTRVYKHGVRWERNSGSLLTKRRNVHDPFFIFSAMQAYSFVQWREINGTPRKCVLLSASFFKKYGNLSV